MGRLAGEGESESEAGAAELSFSGGAMKAAAAARWEKDNGNV